MTIQNMIDELRKLSPEERAELMDELVRIDATENRLSPAQATDLSRRIDDYQAGRTKFTAGEVVVERVRNRRDA
jgi:putative addiction module component (TIGR02574 family)